jgi:fatty acid desaturase
MSVIRSPWGILLCWINLLISLILEIGSRLPAGQASLQQWTQVTTDRFWHWRVVRSWKHKIYSYSNWPFGHYSSSSFLLKTTFRRLHSDLYFDNILILWTLAVKWCMAIASRPHVCGVFNVCLNSRWWFMLFGLYTLSGVDSGFRR